MASAGVTGPSSLPYFAMADISELLLMTASGSLVMATTVSLPAGAATGRQLETPPMTTGGDGSSPITIHYTYTDHYF